ncbi:NifU family protein [Candidatus Peregrinibacteria bacterium]|nr:NifU family protein [Candidatus Peregrinibacteria bacterium]
MKKSFETLTRKQKFEIVEALLKKEVYPMLASDAGGMKLLEVNGFKVQVRYQGACVGCPLAESGTGEFVEHLLKSRLHPRIQLRIEP